MLRLSSAQSARVPRWGYLRQWRSKLHSRQSSGSPRPSAVPPDHFIKTGEREESDPVKINMGRDEYSKSGGDDMVAEQEMASFQDSKDTDPLTEKARAGKGNVINPLEVSPATTELSRAFTEITTEKNVQRDPNAKTGQGTTRKALKIEKETIDFNPSKLKMKGRN